MAIFRAASEAIPVRHPEVPEIDFISYAMLTGDDDPAAGRLRGATVLSGRVDRSPCGTGNSARLACMSARGQAGVGSRFTATSLIDSTFDVELVGTTRGRRAARRCCRASRVAAGSSARASPRSIRAIPTRSATCSRTCGAATSPQAAAVELPASLAADRPGALAGDAHEHGRPGAERPPRLGELGELLRGSAAS